MASRSLAARKSSLAVNRAAYERTSVDSALGIAALGALGTDRGTAFQQVRPHSLQALAESHDGRDLRPQADTQGRCTIRLTIDVVSPPSRQGLRCSKCPPFPAQRALGR